ncbi:hypothetical protein F5887DRAFT_961914, partial [Amanita rubescens]
MHQNEVIIPIHHHLPISPLFLLGLLSAIPSFSHYSTNSLQALQQLSSRHISVNSYWIFFNQASISMVFIPLPRRTIRLTSAISHPSPPQILM